MTTIKWAIALEVVLLIAMPVLAHHPFSAEFDLKKPVTLSGTVTKFDWANPHAYLRANIEDADGTTHTWSFEMGSVIALQKAGWNKETVKPGDKVAIEGWLARSPGKPTTANMKSIRLADGRELSGASSIGPADPQEKIEPKASN
jgi:hypothetical protein